MRMIGSHVGLHFWPWSVYPHRVSLKNMPGHGRIRTYDLWNSSPMLCQLSYADYIDIEGTIDSVPKYRILEPTCRALASIPKVVGSNPTVARHIFQACPVWIYTQSNISERYYRAWSKIASFYFKYVSRTRSQSFIGTNFN